MLPSWRVSVEPLGVKEASWVLNPNTRRATYTGYVETTIENMVGPYKREYRYMELHMGLPSETFWREPSEAGSNNESDSRVVVDATSEDSV